LKNYQIMLWCDRDWKGKRSQTKSFEFLVNAM